MLTTYISSPFLGDVNITSLHELPSEELTLWLTTPVISSAVIAMRLVGRNDAIIAIQHARSLEADSVGGGMSASIRAPAYFWLPALSATDRAEKQLSAELPSYPCASDSDCVGRPWAPVAGMCINASCACPLPSAGADCGRHLRCAQLDTVSQTWLSDNCELSLAHSNPLAFVCACSHLVVDRQPGEDTQVTTAPIAVLEMPLIPPEGLSLVVNVPSTPALELLPYMFSAKVYPLTVLLLLINFAYIALVVHSKVSGNSTFVDSRLSVAQRFFVNTQPSKLSVTQPVKGGRRATKHKRGSLRRESLDELYTVAAKVATALPWWQRGWRAETLVQLKQQHKVLRCFFVRFKLGDNPDLFLTGAQKSTVLISIVLLKMLGAALFYQNSCDVACAFADGAVWLPRGECAERGGFTTQVQEDFTTPNGNSVFQSFLSPERFLAGLLIALLALPATVFLDRVFWQQRHELNAYLARQRGSTKQLQYAAAFQRQVADLQRHLDLEPMFRQWAYAMQQMQEDENHARARMTLGAPSMAQIQCSAATETYTAPPPPALDELPLSSQHDLPAPHVPAPHHTDTRHSLRIDEMEEDDDPLWMQMMTSDGEDPKPNPEWVAPEPTDELETTLDTLRGAVNKLGKVIHMIRTPATTGPPAATSVPHGPEHSCEGDDAISQDMCTIPASAAEQAAIRMPASLAAAEQTKAVRWSMSAAPVPTGPAAVDPDRKGSLMTKPLEDLVPGAEAYALPPAPSCPPQDVTVQQQTTTTVAHTRRRMFKSTTQTMTTTTTTTVSGSRLFGHALTNEPAQSVSPPTSPPSAAETGRVRFAGVEADPNLAHLAKTRPEPPRGRLRYMMWRWLPWLIVLSLIATVQVVIMLIGLRVFRRCPELLLPFAGLTLAGLLCEWFVIDPTLVLVRNNVPCLKRRFKTNRYQVTEKVAIISTGGAVSKPFLAGAVDVVTRIFV